MIFISIYYKVMRKINKLAGKTRPSPQQPKGPNILDQIGKPLLYGLALGFVFEGTFIALRFENRIVKGVTSARLCTLSLRLRIA